MSSTSHENDIFNDLMNAYLTATFQEKVKRMFKNIFIDSDKKYVLYDYYDYYRHYENFTFSSFFATLSQHLNNDVVKMCDYENYKNEKTHEYHRVVIIDKIPHGADMNEIIAHFEINVVLKIIDSTKKEYNEARLIKFCKDNNLFDYNFEYAQDAFIKYLFSPHSNVKFDKLLEWLGG